MDTTEKRNCCGCGACAAVCQNKCIAMESDAEGFLYPHRDEAQCVHCSMCERVCPMLQENSGEKYSTEAYVLYQADEHKRRKGSSGDVFGALAEAMQESGNAVGGIVMDGDSYGASWQLSDNAAALEGLYGSKYIQADISRAYQQLSELVSQGKSALVSGTPCQIEAMRKYPGLGTKQIVYVDVVCHGVPSPKIFRRYVEEWEAKEQSKVTYVSFRDKQRGWRDFSLKLRFKNGREILQSHKEDPFMRLFLRDRILRPSCYQCPYRRIDHPGDLTLADCWGVRGLCQDLDDDKGLSLVLANTERGKKMIAELMQRGVLQGRSLPLDQAIKANANLTAQPALTGERSACFTAMNQCSVEELAERYAKVSWKEGIKEKIKNVLRRIQALF